MASGRVPLTDLYEIGLHYASPSETGIPDHKVVYDLAF